MRPEGCNPNGNQQEAKDLCLRRGLAPNFAAPHDGPRVRHSSTRGASSWKVGGPPALPCCSGPQRSDVTGARARVHLVRCEGARAVELQPPESCQRSTQGVQTASFGAAEQGRGEEGCRTGRAAPMPSLHAQVAVLLLAAQKLPAKRGALPSKTVSSPAARIIGGSEITPAYKHAFLVSLRSFHSHICGGSLIESQWVLTAAHCVDTSRPASSYSVMLHGHDNTAPASGPTGQHRCTEVITAARTICHPSYDSNSMLADICLLQLQRPAACGSELIARNALSHLDYDGTGFASPGTSALVAGWGATSMSDGWGAQPGVPRWPDLAREVTVPVISNARCAQDYGSGQILSDMVCAGDVVNGLVDSCQGDSGGPLFVLSNGRAYQIGVVSWGIGCGLSTHTGVYARVATYRAWIIGHVPSLGRPAGPPAPPSPPSPPRPPPSPPPPPGLCGETCNYAGDGDCDDGGSGAEYTGTRTTTPSVSYPAHAANPVFVCARQNAGSVPIVSTAGPDRSLARHQRLRRAHRQQQARRLPQAHRLRHQRPRRLARPLLPPPISPCRALAVSILASIASPTASATTETVSAAQSP